MSNTDRLVVIRDGYVVADDTGKIPLFVTAACAAAFADELDRRVDGVVFAFSRTVAQIAALLGMYGLTDDAVYDFEATATGPDDAIAWARDLAARCSGPLRDLGADRG